MVNTRRETGAKPKHTPGTYRYFMADTRPMPNQELDIMVPKRRKLSEEADAMVAARQLLQATDEDNEKTAAEEDNTKISKQSLRKGASQAPQLGNHILFLFVGSQRELLTIHSDLLPEVTKTYINDKSQGLPAYQLPEEEPGIARIYRLFLYTSKIFSVADNDQDSSDDGESEAHGDVEWMKLAYCYLFGLTVKDERFANAAIDAIIEKMDEIDRYPTGIASEVYQNTSSGDHLRRLIVDVHVWKGLGQFVRPPHDDADGPKEFLQDVINELASVGGELYEEGTKVPWERVARRCRYYHRHDVTGRCEG